MPTPTLSDRVREQLIDRVTLNRVTVVVGPTGCGKSTLVPVCLLDELGGKVLCTQPRRLAVVSVAQRVSTILQEENEGGDSQDHHMLGRGKVGYHVGQQNISSHHTQLLFATAGILLEDLRANGIETLERYQAICLDECHERSTESDLCMTAIRQMLLSHPHSNIRIVLMSATFDHARYKRYFQGVPGCDKIDTINLETAESFTRFYDKVQTFYLEDVFNMLATGSHSDLKRIMHRDPNLDLDGDMRSLTSNLLKLIVDLVDLLDTTEPLTAPFLIFAPTYRHLEQLYESLESSWYNDCTKPNRLLLSVLHSSVDIEDCLRSMRNAKHSNTRRVLLASAIADSSITIPGVTCVIDTCRSLRVAWDHQKQVHSPRTVWASHSVCDQRQGRTGRTCPGRVFRLLPKGFYLNKLDNFETPQLTLSDCRNETMALLASSEFSDCVGLLGRTMDPPPSHVVQQAIKYLKSIGACIETGGQRSKLVATEYGHLMATLPFAIAESRAILTAAQHGFLHEMLLFETIQSMRPPPIVNYFADETRSARALRKYRSDVNTKDSASVTIAHMAAYMYWDVNWNTEHRKAAYRAFSGSPITGEHRNRLDLGVWQWSVELEELHDTWCRTHEINPTSVRAIADTMDITMKILFLAKFEPKWLRCSPVEPVWQRPRGWKIQCIGETPTNLHLYIYGNDDKFLYRKLNSFLRIGSSSESPTSDNNGVEAMLSMLSSTQEVCIHFLNGNCKYGSECRNAHTLHAKRPTCKYFLFGNCAKGTECMFNHENPDSIPTKVTRDPLKPVAPFLQSMSFSTGMKDWIVKNAETLILLGENDFRFTSALGTLYRFPLLSTELQRSRMLMDIPTDRVKMGVDATNIYLNTAIIQFAQCAHFRGFVWNFPFITGSEENEEAHEDLMSATFLSLALFSRKVGGIEQPYFGITLQGDQFSRWSIFRSATKAGWRLVTWSEFDHKEFPGYKPRRGSGDVFPYEHGRFYLFQLQKSVYELLPARQSIYR